MDSGKSKMAVSISVKDRAKSIGKSIGGFSQLRSVGNFGGKSFSRVRVRKKSYGFGSVAGIRAAERRSSQLGLEFKRPPLLFLNTYQLDPFIKFHVPSVMETMNTVLDCYFSEHKYTVSESPSLAITIAGEVMRNVKALGFNRYRIISVVTLAQKRAQCYNNAVAFLWDHERDAIVDTHRENNTAFVQVTVFGVYLD